MADIREHDRDRTHHQLQVHPQHYGGGYKGTHSGGPSTSQVLAVVTLLPVSGTLLALAGLTLVGTLIALAVTTPLFVIFSPVLVPAALVMGLSVMAFLASGAFGITGLSSLSWVLSSFRGSDVQDQMDYAKRRMQDVAQYAGQKTKDVGQTIQHKAGHEGGRGHEGAAGRT